MLKPFQKRMRIKNKIETLITDRIQVKKNEKKERRSKKKIKIFFKRQYDALVFSHTIDLIRLTRWSDREHSEQ